MLFKERINGGNEKTINCVYKEMINSLTKNKNSKFFYERLYNKFIKDYFGNMMIKNFRFDDIDYFYIFLKHKTYASNKYYSHKYIMNIMMLLKKIIYYSINEGYVTFKKSEISLYISKVVNLY